ncbi:MAG: tRNA (adenosine(37)-N6)-threonylcarbamoyltransferase complex transferase subunit TsaD [Bacteroidetes bacterium]|nr:tRNA (adenosine(37)-N6)-threonylcarbamoyltransferase complex transferase subunit TsaD [Bacteroidota bacterium]
MPYILAIESSCDDTSAAVIYNSKILANVIANQQIHEQFGGVVPELASRAHQQNIIPVVDAALKKANISAEQLDAIAFTKGPGLLGSLLVGCSFAKTFAMSLNIPLIEIDHLEAHILAHFIKDTDEDAVPEFPFLCLLVSGGHTQIILMKDYFKMEIIGQTIDDAAGEAFDKSAKIMSLPYPGGPLIDKYAKEGNPLAFTFPEPNIDGSNFSFSGLKTSFLYFIRDQLKKNPDFIEQNKNDLCASIQYTIVNILIKKFIKAAEKNGVKELAIAGGVSANSGLRLKLQEVCNQKGWKAFIPKFEYSTDNAAMIAIAAYFKFLHEDFASLDASPYARESGRI